MGQFMSTSQFFLYGKKHFTQTGYLKHIASYTEPVQSRANLGFGAAGADDKRLLNKTVLITGANSGLGKQIAMYCAAKDAKVIMMCRNPEKAEAAKDEIVQATGKTDLQIVLCDLAELNDIKRAVAEIQDTKIDCIVCNAGVLLNEERTSKEGWEMTFASHLLGGTYMLTNLLLPKLQASDDGRVVIVTSGGMYNTGLPDWNTMTSYSQTSATKPKSFQYDGNMAYAYAKRGQVVLAEAWSHEWKHIKVVTAHPGWTNTPAVDDAYGDSKKYLEPMRDPWQGAEGIAWLVATDTKNLESGSLYLDRTVQRKHLAGPFFTEGGFTKNTEPQVKEFLEHMKQATGL